MKVTPNVISRRILFCLAAIGFWTACGSDQSGSHAWAQFGPSILPPQREPAGEFGPVRRLPRDPRTQTTYFRSVSSINSGNVAEGISTLQEILDQESDFFLAETPTSSQSMFGQVEQLLAKHHEEYERLFGPTARQILNDARTRQNTVGLEEVVRRFSQTTAGASALEELVQLERDSGEPARAARLLEQLARHPQNKNPRRSITEAIGLLVSTGDDRQARALLARSSDLLPDAAENATLLQRKGSPAIPSIGGAPLYEWRLPFGGVSNIGGSQPAPAFTSTAWKSVLVDDTYDFWLLESPGVAERLGKDTRDLIEATEHRVRASSGRIAMPAGRPLIVNDLVICSGPGSVKAFDIKSGELVWNGLVIDETFEYLAKWSYSAGESQDGTREEMRSLFATVRGWRDLTSTSISTDGRRVYAVTGSQLVGTTSPHRMMQNTQRHPLLPQRSNRLVAYDLATEGKIAWPLNLHLSSASEETFNEPREIFFLGAPLPVGDHLYVLGEERGQVQLFELDPETGGILWSIGLLNPDRDLVLDDARRLSGLMPTWADGLLVCPTGEGTLVAVDPMKRQVVWTHFYSTLPSPQQTQALMMRVVRPQNLAASQAREELLTDQRWFDSRVIVAGSYVIYTPPDDDALICLNLNDGTPVFKNNRLRGQSVYAATVYQDNLILVGRSEISAVSLSGANSLWKRSIPIPNPSGRGIRMGDQFLQPLESREIAVIDLPTGRLLTRFPVPGDLPPGNLAAANGRLLMQSGSDVVALRSLEELQHEIVELLSTAAQDSQGLALRGAWDLQQGKMETGLADLNKSVAVKNDSFARSVLVWSVLDGLRTDFPAYRDQAKQLEQTLEGTEQRLQFLKTFAMGLQNSGEKAAAFSDYLKILQIIPWPETMQDLDSDCGATDSRWALARLAELLRGTDTELRKKLLQQFDGWVAESSDETLLRLLPSIPNGWIPPQRVLGRLVNVPLKPELRNQFEAIFRPMLRHGDARIRTQAAAQLLRLARDLNDTRMLEQMLLILEKEPSVQLGSTEQTTGQSSRDLASATRLDPVIAERLHSALTWPRSIHVGEQQGSASRSSLSQIPRLGPPSPALDGWTFFLDQAGGHIEIFDPQGRHRDRIATGYPGVRFAVETDLARSVSMQGHLAVVVLLDRFLLIDFLNESQSPRLVLNRSITGDGDTVFSGRGPFSVLPRSGLRSSLVDLRSGHLSGNVGPLSASILCYTSGSDLMAISPENGAELWRRRDIVAGSEVLGDDRYVVVKPPEESAVDVYSALDGAHLSRRALPAGVLTSVDRLSGDWGRFLPRVEYHNDQFHWSLYDPARDETAWTHSAPTGTLWSIVDGSQIAFVTTDRQLTIKDGLTGEERFNVKIPSEQKIEQFAVLQYPEQTILCTATHRADAIRRQTIGIRSQDLIQSEVNGLVCAWSPETGDVLWSTEVANQNVVTQSPKEWPILLFAKGRGRMESVILNRFTGNEIRRNSAPDDRSSGISWLTEQHPLRLQLKFGQDRTTLYFGKTPPVPLKPILPDQSESLR